jgi:outer membrane lipoprotein SlyB
MLKKILTYPLSCYTIGIIIGILIGVNLQKEVKQPATKSKTIESNIKNTNGNNISINQSDSGTIIIVNDSTIKLK